MDLKSQSPLKWMPSTRNLSCGSHETAIIQMDIKTANDMIDLKDTANTQMDAKHKQSFRVTTHMVAMNSVTTQVNK